VGIMFLMYTHNPKEEEGGHAHTMQSLSDRGKHGASYVDHVDGKRSLMCCDWGDFDEALKVG